VESPSTYHSISLIALLAWVGLGADGLSSSAYGPDEAFRAIGIHGLALTLCAGILTGIIYEKFALGGWVTVAVTSAVVLGCFLIRRHYQQVQLNLARLNSIMEALPSSGVSAPPPIDRKRPTAVLLVGGYGGMGVHALLTIQKLFPGHFSNIIFVSIGVIDAATMKGVQEVERLRVQTQESLRSYVDLAHRFGLAAESRMAIGTDVLDEGEELCSAIATDFPRALFFLGKLIFERERFFHRILHNETAYQLQRRLQFAGLNAMVLSVRVLEQIEMPQFSSDAA
jgi:hypothetical protein